MFFFFFFSFCKCMLQVNATVKKFHSSKQHLCAALCPVQGIDGKNVNPAFEHFKSSNAEEVVGRGKGQN